MASSPMRRKASLALHWWAVDYLVASALQRDLARYLPLLRGYTLDLGCGNAPYRHLLVNVSHYIGYDRDKLGRAGVVGNAVALPFAAQSFDSVLCTQVIEHVSEPWRVFDEIARVLRPGGRMLLSAPQAWRLHEQPHDYYRFTRYGLTYLTERASLCVRAWSAQGGVWRLVGQAINNWLWERRYPRRTMRWWLSRVFSLTLGTPINLICATMDTIFFDPADTLNLVFVIEKPET
jgi:SAM-dependent methyltransferase